MADPDPDLARARAGDRAAFANLVRRHQRRVYAAALHILGNHADADDVVQETFVRAYKGLAGFDGRSDLFTWLYRIAINTALNTLRSGQRGGALVSRGGAEAAHLGGRPEALGDPAGTDRRAELAEDVQTVLAAVAELSPPLRITLVLATVEGLPYRQISEILEVPEGTVAWRVGEARRLLRLRLQLAPAAANANSDRTSP
ncbi:MAG: sigma-70 family RNA polymerase sigma factor [Kofleriaceae bacterium]|jgi:RNA polymerase sigma-70 factor (ECF subfamily)|nr:sigma-70 family RNA polymerase sigma factor [Kofleriaceae bacterium]MBP6838094.1 sigma-70 family RNA polymerase sigma factor [Kofleriaceae bacterium]MBP9204680.1 sigma-70 family RNA polymerase sigma factor [Kofleriaceae bacterium]